MLFPSADSALEPQLSIADMHALRNVLGDAIQQHQAIALLDVGNQRCRLLISEGRNGHPQPVIHHIPLGLDLLAKRTFKKRMPNEAQLEQGIMLVEDAVMPVARLVPVSNVFVTRDPYLLQVGQHALGVANLQALHNETGRLPVLTREAIEALFDRLALQATRPHVPLADFPASPRWGAALLILREVLHHWQLSAVRLLPSLPLTQSPKG